MKNNRIGVIVNPIKGKAALTDELSATVWGKIQLKAKAKAVVMESFWNVS